MVTPGCPDTRASLADVDNFLASGLPWSAGAGPASRVPLQRVGVVILRIMFVPIDLLFFGIAVYGGWLLSIRRISRLDLSVLAT